MTVIIFSSKATRIWSIVREYFDKAKGTADITDAPAETPAESADEVVILAGNINDNVESETADTEAEAESAEKNNYGTSFPNSNGGRTIDMTIPRARQCFCRLVD